MKNRSLRFWLCFILLNTLLFLPLFLLEMEETAFFPTIPLSWTNPRWTLIQLFSWRHNYDLFRLSMELVLMLGLWIRLGWAGRRSGRRIFMSLYLFLLIYYVYESVMFSLYHVDPVFYNQYFWFRDGITFLLSQLHLSLWVYLGALVVLVVFIYAIGYVVRTMLESAAVGGLGRVSYFGFTSLIVLSLTLVYVDGDALARPTHIISSLLYKVEENIRASFQLYRDINQFDDRTIQQAYNYQEYELVRKPDIYLIFIESYGSVLLKHNQFRGPYTDLTTRLNQQLTENGWHVASTLSDAPTWGGGSWMSYTSTLFGMRIDSHPLYLSLRNKYQLGTYGYPDLGHFLKGQGYEYYWLSSLSVELKEGEWAQYQRFYGVDQWIRYEDMGYQGALYGWGPSPPDQYVLGYARDALLQSSDTPGFVFFITENSHFPWKPLPPVAEDWQSLNRAGEGDVVNQNDTDEERSQADLRADYFAAIAYELEYLTDFVVSQDEDAIFVLVGDHQPPRVARKSTGWDTPIHIISRDEQLIDSVAEYGFVPDLTIETATPTMRHEGLYSLLTRVLTTQYGDGQTSPPVYLPDGIAVTEPSSAVEEDGAETPVLETVNQAK